MIVCFDIGSTLIDGPPVGPARRLAEALSLPVESRRALNQLLFTLDFSGPEALAETLTSRYGTEPDLTFGAVSELWRGQAEEAYVLPGAEEALERLRRAGCRLAFISNIWAPFYQGFRRCLPEWADEWPSFLSFRSGLAKPDTEFYRLALRELGESSEQAVMIGDTYQNDILPARTLGMRTIWLLHRPEKERSDLQRVLDGELPGPDLTFGKIAELYPEQIFELMNR